MKCGASEEPDIHCARCRGNLARRREVVGEKLIGPFTPANRGQFIPRTIYVQCSSLRLVLELKEMNEKPAAACQESYMKRVRK